MINESKASIVGVLRRPPVLRPPTEKTVAKTTAQSEMQPLMMRGKGKTCIRSKWFVKCIGYIVFLTPNQTLILGLNYTKTFQTEK